ncbi:hypothetical protein [Cohnella fermenti]|uniref:Uncharacterized protein n=1 Tax=Cohnella fermenti TaxID=2565925 RepID=A0A4S4BRB9_9BACL|nr:hypothetical protein [Cohnella fermenti]THF77531.1 hypothetical protein E6C55_16060 [Cohnella fermenti]
MLIHDYDAYTIWKMREMELERQHKRELLLRTGATPEGTDGAKGRTGIRQLLSLLSRETRKTRKSI